MKANQHINDEQWARLAKALYDPDPQSTEQDLPAGQGESALPANEQQELERLANKVDLYLELKKYAPAPAWEKVQGKLHRQSAPRTTLVRRLMVHPLMRVAAVLMVTGLLSLAGYHLYSNWGARSELVELVASTEAVRTYTLPDGTLVSLNSNTHLTYPEQFGETTREVTIEGEAFFEVKPDRERPFIIRAGEAQVKVLGTSFNVRAYPEAGLMEVIVKTGKVQVVSRQTAAKEHRELILNPGDKGTLVRESNALLKSINADPNFIAWKTRDLVFRAASLDEVITNLEKVYKVSIRLENPELGRLLLTAHFNNYSLDFILEVIETTFGMQTQRIDGQYVLKAKS
jgi:ferric-dicitrate binding protein FerR (iron transport regulator)